MKCNLPGQEHEEKAKWPTMNQPIGSHKLHRNARDLRWPQPLPVTILLVEDEPAVRMVTREALELGGYRVLEAGTPEAALCLAAESDWPIDLLLTDMVMPGLNGAELARRVRERRPGVATLFMSGYAESEILRLAAREFKNSHIQKPFSVSQLLDRVGAAISDQWTSDSEPTRKGPRLPSP